MSGASLSVLQGGALPPTLRACAGICGLVCIAGITGITTQQLPHTDCHQGGSWERRCWSGGGHLSGG
eukprot:CAMPEP_0202882428 /NCGR_PEP_ID=MMETSP1391-20130828/37983_1 /ASSEMBLY_ACC=CAM_ASM_000867 /TAXON_ID=1034604 /ORGANISM="Chlamydomonas leiostraca, Strain SAG 11-49" /LENGTH=66 /DNA_ID=CAMNT_0049565283 /DNA_START=169 /DNA_END=366 /DNA_ORIENTATION=-